MLLPNFSDLGIFRVDTLPSSKSHSGPDDRKARKRHNPARVLRVPRSFDMLKAQIAVATTLRVLSFSFDTFVGPESLTRRFDWMSFRQVDFK